MISYLNGKPLFEINSVLTLDVRDVGYNVHVTETTLTWALMQSTVSLFIHTIVRETAFDLYGFETKNELYFFKKLLNVSGIGPRSALAMIGLASTDTLYQAIVHDNIEFLTSVPGVGKKTAERMCVELRDKLKDYAGETESQTHDGDTDVIDALVALGYSPAKAYGALANIDQSLTETNDRIKAALNQIN